MTTVTNNLMSEEADCAIQVLTVLSRVRHERLFAEGIAALVTSF